MSTIMLAKITLVILIVQSGRATDVDLVVSNQFTLDSLFPNLDSERSDADLDFLQLAAKYGHPAEEHIVYTADGYRLKVFHLPGYGTELPILLFHGFLDSSDTWIIRGKESLAINLVKAGYDVWLGNVRGNKHSRGHLHLSLDMTSTYWNYSYHEHGIYDLPTTIDLVLNKTGHTKLNSIGHSQGTTIHYVLLSTKPEYNEKVNMLISLAPVAYLEHSPPPLAIVFRSAPSVYQKLQKLHKYDLFGGNSQEYVVVNKFCTNAITAYSVCMKVLFTLCGFDNTEIDTSFSLIVLKHFPTTSTTKNLLHFSQSAISKRFSQFDFGTERNLEVYNAATPPPYDLSKVNSKMVLLTARNDFFSQQADVTTLRRQLPNVVRFVINPRSKMNHLDYVWGENMGTYLFPYIFDSLKRYTVYQK